MIEIAHISNAQGKVVDIVRLYGIDNCSAVTISIWCRIH